MKNLAIGVLVGAAVNRSYNTTLDNVGDRSARLRRQLQQTNARLAAVIAAVKNNLGGDLREIGNVLAATQFRYAFDDFGPCPPGRPCTA